MPSLKNLKNFIGRGLLSWGELLYELIFEFSLISLTDCVILNFNFAFTGVDV